MYGPNPLEDLTDLCGGRVIFPTLGDVAECCDSIEQNFHIHWEDSEDKLSLLSVQEFGYLSNHYVVRLLPDSPLVKTMDVPEHIFQLKAEIQVRTFLQHAFAVIQHDYLYKPNFAFPERIRRQFNRIAAILEDADVEFGNSLETLQSYEANYGAYLSPEQINEQMDRLLLVYENSPSKANEVELVLRIAKLARYVARWEDSIRLLEGFAESGNPSLLRELGLALSKSTNAFESEEFKRGQSYMAKAAELDPQDADTLAALAGSWKKIDLDTSIEFRRRAYEIDPEDPYTFQNFLISKIVQNGSADIVEAFLPGIKGMVKISAGQIARGINMPWAYFNHGLFSHLLGDTDNGLNSYLLSLHYCTARWMIATHLNDLNSLSLLDTEYPALRNIRHLLKLGLVVRFDDGDALLSLRDEEGALANGLKPPVTIIAGTTSQTKEELGEALREALLGGFGSYKGTVISGSTTSGVCQLVGDLQKAFPASLKTVGYIPSELPDGIEVDFRFSDIHKTEGTNFSFLEALRYWTDIVLSSVDPTGVRLLGVGGGALSALEYRLALVLGARVAILAESVGSGIKFLQDPAWQELDITIIDQSASAVAAFLMKE